MKKYFFILLALFFIGCSSEDLALEKDTIRDCSLPKITFEWRGNKSIVILHQGSYEITSGDKIVFKYTNQSPKCANDNLVDKRDKTLFFEVPSNINEFEYIGDDMHSKGLAIFEAREGQSLNLILPVTQGYIKGKKVGKNWNIKAEVQVAEQEGRVNEIKIEHIFSNESF